MKAIWKWIIGIAIVLVVVAVVVGGVFLLRSNFFNGIARVVQVPNGRGPFNGQHPYNGPYGMMPYGRHGFPMMGGRGFGYGMLPFAGIFGLLFFAGLVVLVTLGIIWAVRRGRQPMPVAAPMAVAAPQTPPPAPAVMAPASAVTMHACKKCGQPVPEGANYCPNCGKKQ